ncbi:MAG: hypothetical protein JWO77_1823 [Ilumatobacteraceae bacterium]|nr:hypothetical protein [Ilumatobacteraceae bacterium]
MRMLAGTAHASPQAVSGVEVQPVVTVMGVALVRERTSPYQRTW